MQSFWQVAYANGNKIPSDTLARLATLGNTNKTSIFIEHPDLIPGELLEIKGWIATEYERNSTPSVVSITVPAILFGKLFCGPCQFYDRDKCLPLNGVCWSDYTNVSAEIWLTEAECLKAMAKECYRVWKANGTSDKQCADFVTRFDFALMQTKPNVSKAAYSTDGSAISITFNTSMRQTGFSDCSQVFNSSTLNYLPDSKSAKWVGPSILQVDYNPSSGITETLEFAANAMYADVPYAQEPLDPVTVNVGLHTQLVDHDARTGCHDRPGWSCRRV